MCSCKPGHFLDIGYAMGGGKGGGGAGGAAAPPSREAGGQTYLFAPPPQEFWRGPKQNWSSQRVFFLNAQRAL